MSKCVICGKEYTGFGNNALPVKKGQCCDICNATKVIPKRTVKILDIICDEP